MYKYNDHRKLEGKHAYIGCSQFSWENRTDEQLVKMYYSKFASEIGTAIHQFASECIKRKIKLKKTDENMIEHYIQVIWVQQTGVRIPIQAYDSRLLIETVSTFVNDAIDYHMDSEVILAYDEIYAFGTSDAFICDEYTKTIRVHDLKTGIHPVKMTQLMLYAAQYCLEYNKKPKDYKFETRIYQGDSIIEYYPTSSEIEEHMKKIVHAVSVLNNAIERI